MPNAQPDDSLTKNILSAEASLRNLWKKLSNAQIGEVSLWKPKAAEPIYTYSNIYTSGESHVKGKSILVRFSEKMLLTNSLVTKSFYNDVRDPNSKGITAVNQSYITRSFHERKAATQSNGK